MKSDPYQRLTRAADNAARFLLENQAELHAGLRLLDDRDAAADLIATIREWRDASEAFRRDVAALRVRSPLPPTLPAGEEFGA